jgi:hypothetical protein
MTTGILDEAYERLSVTGPEFVGWLSNHGPMAAEAMVRGGHDAHVHRWIDTYAKRLEPRPAGGTPIGDETWREALGDPDRIGDWLTYFERAVRDEPWRDVLATWWPRLLPGIAASATHGVIRVGHAIRSLDEVESPARVAELAYGLGYWAGRWQEVPGAAPPTGTGTPAEALRDIAPIATSGSGFADRMNQLDDSPEWTRAVAAGPAATTPDQAPDRLIALVDAAVFGYLERGHGSPVLLVHAATAPNAVLRSLPVLPRALWVPSWTAAWSASAALTALFAAPDRHAGSAPDGLDAGEVTTRAVAHGDEHAIKLTDTAVDVYARTRDPRALAAAVRATELIDPLPV